MPEFDLTGMFVSDGISNGRWWATFRRTGTGSLARVVNRWLPERDTREEAEADLRRYLEEFAYRGRSRPAREAGKKALTEHGWLNDAVEGTWHANA